MLEAAEILNATILIVDDQETNIMLLEQMLRNEGYSNITTTQQPRAVQALHREHRFDLILMDVQMPEMDGPTATGVIRARERAENRPRTPIVALTANAFEDDRRACLDAGMDDFLTKPIDAGRLRQTLARLVGRSERV